MDRRTHENIQWKPDITTLNIMSATVIYGPYNKNSHTLNHQHLLFQCTFVVIQIYTNSKQTLEEVRTRHYCLHLTLKSFTGPAEANTSFSQRARHTQTETDSMKFHISAALLEWLWGEWFDFFLFLQIAFAFKWHNHKKMWWYICWQAHCWHIRITIKARLNSTRKQQTFSSSQKKSMLQHALVQPQQKSAWVLDNKQQEQSPVKNPLSQ